MNWGEPEFKEEFIKSEEFKVFKELQVKGLIKSISKNEPSVNSKCLCGSGIKFKKCCKEIYKNKGLVKSATSYYNRGKFEEARKFCRAHITWYVLCYKSHTEPILAYNRSVGERWLEIDINAMSDLISLLCQCYYKLGASQELISVLDIVYSYIPSKVWCDKINFQKAFHLSLLEKNELAHYELSKIDIDCCDDSEILTFYYELNGEKFNFKEKVDLCDKILKNVNKPSDSIQYSCLKALNFYFINDDVEGKRLLTEAISDYKKLPLELTSIYGNWHFAHALEMLAIFESSNELMQEAVNAHLLNIENFIKQSFFKEFVANEKRALAGCYQFLNLIDLANDLYLESLGLNDSELTKVFWARTLVAKKEVDEARDLLLNINLEDFCNANHFDFAVSWSALAFATREQSDLDKAKVLLSLIENQNPYFQNSAKQTLIELFQTTVENKVSVGTKMKRFIQRASKYLELKPNVFGLGVNINAIIDDSTNDKSNIK